MNNILFQIKEVFKNEKNHFWLFFTILIFLTVLTMFRYSVFTLVSIGQDASFHYNRFNILMEALRDGTFPAYLDSKAINNYGYASTLFYPNFTFIPFALIGNIIGIFRAYQLMYFTYTILTGLIMYLSVYKVYKNKKMAYISAILYTFCLYRLQDYFERAAIAEAITFTFLPLVFWGLYEIIKGDYKKWYILAIGYSLFVLTHILATLFITIILAIVVIIYSEKFIKEPKRVLFLLFSVFSTIFCSAFFLFPFLEQNIYDSFNFETFNFPFERVALKDIPKALLSYRFLPGIGITLILPLVIRFFIYDKEKVLKNQDIFVISAFLIILYTSDLLPLFLYPNILFGNVQFLWRLFEFCSFLLALPCGYYLAKICKNNLKSTLVLSGMLFLVVIIIFLNSSSYKYARWGITNLPEREVSNNFFLGFSAREYLPIPATVSGLVERGEIISTKNSNTQIKNINRLKNGISFDIKTSHSEVIELPLVYYKGYYANINNQVITIQKSKNGLIEVLIDKSGHIQVKFEGTFIQKYSLYITLISFLVLAIYALNRKKYKLATKF